MNFVIPFLKNKRVPLYFFFIPYKNNPAEWVEQL